MPFSKSIICLCLLSLALLKNQALCQNLVINEVSTDNETIITDEDGDYSDWIELHNNSASPINLTGYAISDDLFQPDQWAFPDIEIPAEGFLIVFASGKNRTNGELHTNFSLSSDGETLVLTDAGGSVLNQIFVQQLEDDEVMGRLPDGGSDWFDLPNPTPGASNEQNEILQFSHPSGFYTSPLSLSASSVLGDTVRFTTNGDDPTISSEIISEPLELGFTYEKPNYFCNIPTTGDESQIGDHAWQMPAGNIDKAHIVRFATFRNGQRTSEIYTKTIFIDSTGKQLELPVFSIVTPEKNLFDDTIGIYTPGIHFDTNDPVWTGNFFQRGSQWERPAHINYFNEAGTLEFEQNAGIRIHGFKTRNKAQKSLRLYARNEYGEKYFNYPLLPQRNLDRYKRIMLRAAMGSWHDQSIVKDVVAHQIAKNLDIEYQEYQPAVVYVNGEYWGIHTIRDRIDERYVEYLTGVNKDSVEFINGTSLDLFELAQQNDLSTEEGFDLISDKLDIDNYIDYHIAEMFFANYDWISNNWELWRNTSTGKWRSVFFDLDGGLNDPAFNMFEFCTNQTEGGHPQPEYTSLFRGLLENDEFKSKFISRFAEVLNTEFTQERMDSILTSVKEKYEAEVQRHLERWNYPDSYTSWEEDIEGDGGLREFLDERPCIINHNIVEFFNLSYFDFDCSGDNPEWDTDETLVISPNPSTGIVGVLNTSGEKLIGTLQLYNSHGQLLGDREHVEIDPGNRFYFSLADHPSGVYLVRFRTANQNIVKRVVIAEKN